MAKGPFGTLGIDASKNRPASGTAQMTPRFQSIVRAGRPRQFSVLNMEHTKDVLGPETRTLLRAVLNEAWDALTPEQQALNLKSEMALRMLRLAQQGERNPATLRVAAMLGVPPGKRPPAPSVARGSEGTQARKKIGE
jgi:hypothetical protein